MELARHDRLEATVSASIMGCEPPSTAASEYRLALELITYSSPLWPSGKGDRLIPG